MRVSIQGPQSFADVLNMQFQHVCGQQEAGKSGACRWQGHLGTIANSKDVADEPSLAQI